VTISAAFTVNGNSNPATHTTTYGATVTLALTSIVGASSIQWSIAGSSDSTITDPTITPAGSPSGATATFTFPSDPGTGRGRAVLVKCLVSDGTVNTGALRDADQGTHWSVQYALIGVAAANGVVPICANETLVRSLTHGWVEVLNNALAGGDKASAKFWARVTVSGGTPTLADSINVTSITDTGTGQLTVTIGTDFSNANWVAQVSVERTSTALTVANLRYCAIRRATIAAGSVQVECWDGTATTANQVDPESWSVTGFGS
jgi:hypothetical protein